VHAQHIADGGPLAALVPAQCALKLLALQDAPAWGERRGVGRRGGTDRVRVGRLARIAA
jgi:hypothetical protein